MICTHDVVIVHLLSNPQIQRWKGDFQFQNKPAAQDESDHGINLYASRLNSIQPCIPPLIGVLAVPAHWPHKVLIEARGQRLRLAAVLLWYELHLFQEILFSSTCWGQVGAECYKPANQHYFYRVELGMKVYCLLQQCDHAFDDN